MAKIAKEVVEKQAVSFDEAVSMTGYGTFHIIMLLATGGCLMCVIIETMGMMFIVPAAQCDLQLDLTLKGLLSSVSFFGVVASSYMWGYIADTRGRRKVLIVSLVIACMTSLVCSIIPWAWLFILLRFINGYAIGGASSTVYAYAGEFHDNHFRPKVITWMSTFVAMGNIILPSLAWLILPMEWSFDIPVLAIAFRPWRLLLVLYTLPCLLVALLIYMLPESPKYLVSQHQKAESLAILQQMYAINKRKPKSEFPVTELIWEELSDIDPKKAGMMRSMWNQTVPLFKGELLMKTLMMCYMQFGIFASNAGIVMWYPEILNKMSHYYMHNTEPVSMCTAFLAPDNFVNQTETGEILARVCNDAVKTDVFMVSILMGIAYASIYIFIGTVINMIGKKQLMITFVTVTTLTGIASQYVEGYMVIQFLVGIFIMGGAGIGITNAIAVDLFPTQVRAMALAVSLMCGRIGAMTGTNIVGPLMYNLCDYIFYVFAVDHLLLIIICFMLPIGNKLQKLTV